MSINLGKIKKNLQNCKVHTWANLKPFEKDLEKKIVSVKLEVTLANHIAESTGIGKHKAKNAKAAECKHF